MEENNRTGGKMGCILYTQRVEVIESYNERRDCAHQNIPQFITACGYLPVPLPNIPENIEAYFLELKPEGIVMTGGNSLIKYGGNAPEKDKTDYEVIRNAIKYKVPVYAFCRGMQSVLDYFGNVLIDVEGHVAKRHFVTGLLEKREVNSYHQQGTFEVTDDFEILCRSEDGLIEAIRHKEYPIVAFMWHPEREEPFQLNDISCLKNLVSE